MSCTKIQCDSIECEGNTLKEEGENEGRVKVGMCVEGMLVLGGSLSRGNSALKKITGWKNSKFCECTNGNIQWIQ